MGALTLFSIIITAVRWLFKHCGPARSVKQYGGRGKGGWAVVTGATDGIGKGMAQALAEQGFNIALVSRTEAKLNEVAAELTAKNPKITTKVIVVDAASADTTGAVGTVSRAVQGLPVTVLVNNVGVNVDFPTELTDTSAADVDRIIRVNCLWTAQLTRAVIPALQTRDKAVAPRACIMNVSSAFATLPAPLLAVYAGTKAFDDAFSVSLSAELAASKIDVMSVLPGLVSTPMSKIRPSLGAPTGLHFARTVVHQMGGSARSIPFWFHSLLVGVGKLLPESVVASQMNAHSRTIRSKALKKAERVKAEAAAATQPPKSPSGKKQK